MDNAIEIQQQPAQGWWIFKNKEAREAAKAEKEARRLAAQQARDAKKQAKKQPQAPSINRDALVVADDIYDAPSASQKNTSAQAYWDAQMEKHPGFHFFLSVIGSIVEFFFGGHFIVWLARKVILFSSRTAESALLFASLWISAIYSAHDFMVRISFGQSENLTNMSVLAFTLLPEIVLFSAIITCVIHWYSAIAKGQKGDYVWGILYVLPTIVFFVLAVYTFTAVIESKDHVIPMANGESLVIRAVTSWIYALIGMVHSGLRKRFPGMSVATAVATNVATQSTPATASQASGVAVNLPRVKRPVVATTTATLMVTEQDTDKVQIEPESSQDTSHNQGHYPNTGELKKVATNQVTTVDDILDTNEATNTDPELATPKVNSKVTKKLDMSDIPESQSSQKTSRPVATKSATPKATRTVKSKRDKAIQIVQGNPDITPAELRKRAKISLSYAKQIKAEKAS